MPVSRSVSRGGSRQGNMDTAVTVVGVFIREEAGIASNGRPESSQLLSGLRNWQKMATVTIYGPTRHPEHPSTRPGPSG